MAPILVSQPPRDVPSVFLRDTLTNHAHIFLQPTTSLHSTSLAFLKETLDPLAARISQAHVSRHQHNQRKRKREPLTDSLRLKQLHVQGFDVDQVWEQVRRILDAARSETKAHLDQLRLDLDQHSYHTDSSGISEPDNQPSALEDDDGDISIQTDQDLATDDDDDDDDNYDLLDQDTSSEEATAYAPDSNGLNDGFFSIDDFNRQSVLMEQADARGDLDDADSDEDPFDFTADPLAITAAPSKPRAKAAKRSKQEAESDDSDDDDGPGFGNMDLDAPEGASEDDLTDVDQDADGSDMDIMGDLSNTNNITYKDFFAPPAQKVRKNKKGRPNPHNFPAKQDPASKDEEEDETNVDRTISAVHRDLFEDESEEEATSEKEVFDPSDPRSRKTTHERRQAALAQEIRQLEAANVAKRDWTLQGEARAADRPINSLLEEDLDFERTGKPVPVATAEVSESIEELIKRRILTHDFQDLVRRRPDELATNPAASRAKSDFELSDAKSKKGLAEMYEEDHLRATDETYMDAATTKSQREEAEIQSLWRDLAAKLDSLSSWHFRPRQPQPTIDIRVDAPAIRLEDARPTAGAEAATTASLLAPHEIYRAGSGIDKTQGETTTRGGMPLAREEMDRETKKRRRRRDKERIGKKNSARGGAVELATTTGGVKKRDSQKEVIGQLKRGAVRVIGKGGEMKDIEGNRLRAGSSGTSLAGAAVRAGNLKL